MKRNQAGFTLIELVMVIVILGVLAAVALPKFVDLSTDAGNAAVAGVAGGLSSASSINYAAKSAGKTVTPILNGDNTATCDKANMEALVAGVTFTTGTGASLSGSAYNVSPGAGTTGVTCVASAGTTTYCTIQGSKGSSTQVPIVCTGP